jgi:hypothetical protein
MENLAGKNVYFLLDGFEKLRKETISYVISVRMEQHWKDIHDI